MSDDENQSRQINAAAPSPDLTTERTSTSEAPVEVEKAAQNVHSKELSNGMHEVVCRLRACVFSLRQGPQVLLNVLKPGTVAWTFQVLAPLSHRQCHNAPCQPYNIVPVRQLSTGETNIPITRKGD